MDIAKKDILKFTFLPGFVPRLKTLFASGFQYVPYFIALVYGAVRLLPENHPYLQGENIGKYGLRHVVAAAANNLEFSRNRIDQVILFFTILVGLVIVMIQLFLLVFAIISQPALAAMPTNFAGFFLQATEQDLAYMMLDLVFGVPDVFNSCVAQGTGCLDGEGRPINAAFSNNWGLQSAGIPFPVHQGLHRLFTIYSLGLLVVAVFISLYFMVTVIAETAQSGTPFGKRFNKVWAPIRIVVAFGLLIPIGVGMNASQYIVLYAAKFGTGFANQGWQIFNSNLIQLHGIATVELVAQPNIPEVGALLQFLFTAKTCAEVENITYGETGREPIQPYLVRGQLSGRRNLLVGPGTNYQEMIGWASGDMQVVMRFGRAEIDTNAKYAGSVAPTCGELVIPFTDPRTAGEPAVLAMQQYYWYIIREIWYQVLPGQGGFINGLGGINYPNNYMRKWMTSVRGAHNPNAPTAEAPYRTALLEFYQDDVRAAMANPGATGISGVIGGTGAIELMQTSGRWRMNSYIMDKGWGCAACIYNRIAEMNGALTTAILNIPMPTRYPFIMEEVYEQKRKQDEAVTFSDRFKPEISKGAIKFSSGEDGRQKANAMWHAFDFWQQGGGVSSPHSAPTGNAIIDTINALMGTEGLFNMRQNATVHPIAQLSGAGRALVEAAVRNLSYAAIGAGSGMGLKFLGEDFFAQSASSASGFLITFAMISLTAGFILFYVIPFLPFIYFFFAFGGWVKGIFEAMVGAPLWALAHIRIDGNGLSGQAALSGYFLIFEVFLRPILMVFGLIASISIFSALVKVLNQIFTLVVVNLMGFDVNAEFTLANGLGTSNLNVMRSAIDEFFFTVVYVLIVYMMGMSSFKLVDLIPNNILRWMGQTVASFGDQKDDPTQKLVSTATVGSQQATNAIGGGLGQLAGMAGR